MAAAASEKANDVELDYTFELPLPLRNFHHLGMGESRLGDTYTHGGVSWRLRVERVILEVQGWSHFECFLRLVNLGTEKPKLARIRPLVPSAEPSLPALFQQNGEESGAAQFAYQTAFSTVSVAVEVFKYLTVPSRKPLRTEIEVAKSQMANDMLKRFQSEGFGDTTIVAADGKKFRCHRDMLTARSEVFDRMFNTPMKESNENLVKIDGYEGDIVAQLLVFVYIDDCGEIGPIADRLYVAAHHYQLDRLKILCESAMADSLSADTIVKTYQLATFYQLDNLMDVCISYLDTHNSELIIANLLDEALKLGAQVPFEQE